MFFPAKSKKKIGDWGQCRAAKGETGARPKGDKPRQNRPNTLGPKPRMHPNIVPFLHEGVATAPRQLEPIRGRAQIQIGRKRVISRDAASFAWIRGALGATLAGIRTRRISSPRIRKKAKLRKP